jgi:heme/copper-type cytochrome/quinol oxidase subunit 2
MFASVACGAPALAAQRAVEVVLERGRPIGVTQAVRVVRDDEVTLTVRSDRADELHLHGYNLQLHLEPGRPGTLHFTARRTGRFSVELHKSEVEIVVFEIYPK